MFLALCLLCCRPGDEFVGWLFILSLVPIINLLIVPWILIELMEHFKTESE